MSITECATLYVGDLHLKVTEKILFQKFCAFGKILSIRICRDSLKNVSLGYGYVNFSKKIEAQTAMEELNLTCIYGQPCRIMWFEKDPSKRLSGIGNIVIKDLDECCTINEIKDTFGKFGEITSCKLKNDSAGVPMGWAYVNYKHEEDAEKAIQDMDQQHFGGSVITVEKYITKISISKDHLKTCYVENCSAYLDDNILRLIFEKFGTVIIAKIMITEDGISKGFGFVTFKEIEEAANATKCLNGETIHDKRIHVYRVTSKVEVTNTNLYINNISKDVNEDLLRKEFEIFGKISSVKIMSNPRSKKHLGYGFVSFHDQNSATKAVKGMNGKIVCGKELFVDYNKTSVPERQRHISEPIKYSCANDHVTFTHNNPSVPMPILTPSFQYILALNNFTNNSSSIPYQQNSNTLQSKDFSKSKQILMESIHPFVYKHAGDKYTYVVKKLLDFDNSLLFAMVDNEDILKNEVEKIIDDLFNESHSNTQLNNELKQVIEENVSNIENLSPGIINEEDGECLSNEEDCLEYKEFLGCKLYPLVSQNAGEMVKEIISLFLKRNKAELLYMLENEDFLKLKISEAQKEMRDAKISDNSDLNIESYGKDTGIELTDNDANFNVIKNSSTDEKQSINSLSQPNNLTDQAQSIPIIQPNKLFIGNPFTDPYRLFRNQSPNINWTMQPINMTHNMSLRPFFYPNFQRLYNMPTSLPFQPWPPLINANTMPQGQNIMMMGNFDWMNNKQVLGDKLFSLISKHTMNADEAKNITVMFLRFNNDVLKDIIENETFLKDKVLEAQTYMNIVMKSKLPMDQNETALQKKSNDDAVININNDFQSDCSRNETSVSKSDKVQLKNENKDTKSFITGFGFN